MTRLPEYLIDAISSEPVNGITATIQWKPVAVDGLYAVMVDEHGVSPGPHRALSAVHLSLVKSTAFSEGSTDGEKLVASIAQMLTEVFRRKVTSVYFGRELSERLNITHDSRRNQPETEKNKFFFVYGESYQRLQLI